MPVYLLDKAYKVTDSAGVDAYRVVVQGTNDAECALPSAANAGSILGVTTHSADDDHSVSVRKAGIASVMAGGVIAVGTAVNIHGTTGKVKAIDETAGTKVNCIGFAETAAAADGDIIDVFISIHQRTT